MIIYTYPKYSNNDDNKYYKFLMKLKRKKKRKSGLWEFFMGKSFCFDINSNTKQ